MQNSRFENNLWKFRKIANLKQKDLAYLLGIKNISQISRWEKGERLPSLKNCFKLSVVFGCSVEEIFSDLYEKTKNFIEKRKKQKDKENQEK